MQLQRVSDATNSEGFLRNVKVANPLAFCYQIHWSTSLMQLRAVSDATNSEGSLREAKKFAIPLAFCYQNRLDHVFHAVSTCFLYRKI